jgi:hypothetical protein
MGVQPTEWHLGHPVQMESVTSYDQLFETGFSIPSFKGGFTRKGPRAPLVVPAAPAPAAPSPQPARRSATAPQRTGGRVVKESPHAPFREVLTHRPAIQQAKNAASKRIIQANASSAFP